MILSRMFYISCLVFMPFMVLLVAITPIPAANQNQMKSEWGQTIQESLITIVKIYKYPDFAGASAGTKEGWEYGSKAGRKLGEWAGGEDVGGVLGAISAGVIGAGAAEVGKTVASGNAHSPKQVSAFLEGIYAISHKSKYQLDRLRKIANSSGAKSEDAARRLADIEPELNKLIQFVDARYPLSTHPLAFKEIAERMSELVANATELAEKIDEISYSLRE